MPHLFLFYTVLYSYIRLMCIHLQRFSGNVYTSSVEFPPKLTSYVTSRCFCFQRTLLCYTIQLLYTYIKTYQQILTTYIILLYRQSRLYGSYNITETQLIFILYFTILVTWHSLEFWNEGDENIQYKYIGILCYINKQQRHSIFIIY